jgi:hypothetical protein
MPFFNKNKLPTTPYAIVIDISKKGNKAEIDLRIKNDKERKRLEPEIIAFELAFVPYDPRQDPKSKYYINPIRLYLSLIGSLRKYFEPKYTDEEWSEILFDDYRVTRLVGGSVPNNLGNPSMGRYPTDYVDYKGIPIPNIRLTIINLDDPNKTVVYDKVLEVRRHPEIHGYFDKFLSYIKLAPFNYKIIAEVQSDAPEFKGTKVILRIGYYRAKV